MKVVPFTIPVKSNESISVSRNKLKQFYPHLHRHQQVQITYIIKGTGVLIAGNYVQNFQPGELYVFGKNLPHVFKSANRAGCENVTIFFDTDMIEQNLLAIAELKNLNQFLQTLAQGYKIEISDDIEINRLLETMHKKQPLDKTISFLQLLAYIRRRKDKQILSSLKLSNIVKEEEGSRLNAIYQYVLQNFSSEISAEHAAGLIGLTLPSFCRYFKKHTEKNFISFVNEVRVNEVHKYLQQLEKYNLNSVAFDCGFHSVNHLCRTFKQVTGYTITQYKKMTANI